MKKVLFIVKCRGTSYQQTEDTVKLLTDNNEGYPQPYCMSSGLFNSANFVSEMLNQNGVESKIVQVGDNNDIDRETSNYKPTHVMIEALWVVPEKFRILHKLHPDVKWIVRLHSEMPFLSNEGNAIDWVLEYIKHKNVFIAANTMRMYNDVKNLVSVHYDQEIANKKTVYLPNYYIEHSHNNMHFKEDGIVNISTFGALRPLKNQLSQALAAIDYAKMVNKKLKFHINVARVEYGNNALKNIRAVFQNLDTDKFELVQHSWLSHHDFLKLVKGMDVAMQVSYSETCNLVTCDAVSQNVPVVVSSEINWVNKRFWADPNSIPDMVYKISKAIRCKKIGAYLNMRGLRKYNKKSMIVWLNYFKHHTLFY